MALSLAGPAAVHGSGREVRRTSPTRARSASWPSCSSTRSSRSSGSSSGRWLGGGNFRFLGYPDAGSNNGYSDFKDTIAAGPLLVGAAGGLYYEAAKSTSLVVEINEIAGLPTFGLVTDVNFALQFNIYSAPPPKPAAGALQTGSDQEEPK